MDFLSIFLEDCQILNFQGLVFIPNMEKITALGFKVERKITNQSLGGLRTENQGVQSPQTFLVKTFFFLQSP